MKKHDVLVTRYFNSFDGKSGSTVQPLPKAEELKLFRRWKKNKDRAALNKLILANLKFVVTCANKFDFHSNGKAIDINDLIQAGNEGLMQAIEHFKPARNCRLITYAVHWINAYIRNFIYANVSTVRVSMNNKTKSLIDQRHTAFSLLNGKDPGALSQWREAFKEKHGISEKIMQNEELKIQSIGSAMSIDRKYSDFKGTGPGKDMHDDLTSDQYNTEYLVENKNEQDLIKKRVREALKRLPQRDRDILRARFGIDKSSKDIDGLTLQQCGNKHRVSRERVRQLEERALDMLKGYLKKDRAICEIVGMEQ